MTQASLPAPKKRRKSYPIRFKALAIRALKMTLMLLCLLCGKSAPSDNTNPSPVCPDCGVKYEQKTQLHKNVALTLGINPSMLSKWNAEAEQILDLEKESGSIRKAHRGGKRELDTEEDALFTSFCNMRVNLGLPVDHFWLRQEMMKILTHEGRTMVSN